MAGALAFRYTSRLSHLGGRLKARSRKAAIGQFENGRAGLEPATFVCLAPVRARRTEPADHLGPFLVSRNKVAELGSGKRE
jgi:hypothetical protein